LNRADGGCHCGNILVDLQIAGAPEAYHPRACDCDFCRKHCAAYVSDPHGSLAIHIKDPALSSRYHHGHGIADFLICRNCGVLVAVLHRSDERLYAAINAHVIGGGTRFGAEQPISPKTLNDIQKIERWRDLWFSHVEVIGLPDG
jgi:hypothetical protein